MVIQIIEHKNENEELLYRPSIYFVEKKLIYFIPLYSCNNKECLFLENEKIFLQKPKLISFCINFVLKTKHSKVKKKCSKYFFKNNKKKFFDVLVKNINFLKRKKNFFKNNLNQKEKFFSDLDKYKKLIIYIYKNNFFNFINKKELILNDDNDLVLKNKSDYYYKKNFSN